MAGHHLILGKLVDVTTGESLDDTHDERLRQAIASLLIEKKGYTTEQILPRQPLVIAADGKRARIKIDFLVRLDDRIGMLIKYGPGSIITRHRPALAAGRLMAPYQIPTVVATNGRTADILDGHTGEKTAEGLVAIPDKKQLTAIMKAARFNPISIRRAELESRVLYCYEVDGSCPCDDDICRL